MEVIAITKDSIDIGKERVLTILSLFPLCLIILAFIFDNPKNIYKGLYRIVVSPDILLTDYISVGGIGATFINAGVLTLVNIFIIWKLKLKVNGALIASVFTIMGFSFIGKNLFNVWPIYLGGYLYVKYQQINFKNIVVIMMFSTALAPVVSEISFGLHVSIKLGLPIGILFGILIGFVITPLSSHLIKVHDGYNLYNIGFTAGLIGSIITSVLRGFGLIIKSTEILSTEYDSFLKLLLISCFILLIFLGYYINGKSFKGYKNVLHYSGKTVTDFTQLCGYGITFINMGIMGLIGIAYVVISKGIVNGPITAGILTMVGFAAFGKHPRNAIPILIGVFIAANIKIWNPCSTVVIIGALFGTTLAPVAGAYGPLAGILAGFLHLSVVMNIGVVHGGLNLYNNGFSGGVVAAIVVPLIEAFKKGDYPNEKRAKKNL